MANAMKQEMTLAEFRRKNPDYAWVGTKDRAGIYQFGGLDTLLEYVVLPRGADFHPADFTGTSPRGISAIDCDLRGSKFDDYYNDFTDFNAQGTRLGGAHMPGADIHAMYISRTTSFYDTDYGGAYLAESNAERQHFEGVDLRDVDATGSRWSYISVDKQTKTNGLNLAYAEVYAS